MSWEDLKAYTHKSNKHSALRAAARAKIPRFELLTEMLEAISGRRRNYKPGDPEYEYWLAIEKALVEARECCFDLIMFEFDMK